MKKIFVLGSTGSIGVNTLNVLRNFPDKFSVSALTVNSNSELLLKQINEAPDEMVVDGYVALGNKPGLGQHLFQSMDGKIPVIGVAKSKFEGSSGAELLRGGSIRPLYVTSAGMAQRKASERIGMMHGAHRVPTLLKRVDILAREKAQQIA